MNSTEDMSINHVEPINVMDWFSQGESCTLQVGAMNVVIRFVGRKGRRARIAVTVTQRDGPQLSHESVIPVDNAFIVK